MKLKKLVSGQIVIFRANFFLPPVKCFPELLFEAPANLECANCKENVFVYVPFKSRVRQNFGADFKCFKRYN